MRAAARPPQRQRVSQAAGYMTSSGRVHGQVGPLRRLGETTAPQNGLQVFGHWGP